MKASLVTLSTLLAAAAADVASACSCVGPASIAEAWAHSDVVFVGRVISVRDADSPDADSRFGKVGAFVQELWSEITGSEPVAPQPGTSRYGEVAKFRITETFKGVSGRTVEVHTGYGGGDCGFPFEEGTDYVVFATFQEDKSSHGRRFVRTGICSRTARTTGNGTETYELRRLASVRTR
jgi:hypothetical protein